MSWMWLCEHVTCRPHLESWNLTYRPRAHRTERLKSYSAAHCRQDQEGARSEMHAPCPYVLPRAEQCSLAGLLQAFRFRCGRQPWSVRSASHLTSVRLGMAVVEIEADVERNAATTSIWFSLILFLSVAYYTVTGSPQVLAILLALSGYTSCPGRSFRLIRSYLIYNLRFK